MQLVRARSGLNKLEVCDNRPFAIDMELQEEGFIVHFTDLMNGEKREAFYLNRKRFDEEWKLCCSIGDESFVEYKRANYYWE